MSAPTPMKTLVTRRTLAGSAMATLLGVALLQVYERRLVAEIRGGDTVAVLTLVRDLPAGTALNRDALGVRGIPEAYVERRSIHEADLDKIIGLTVAIGLKATESLLWTDLDAGRPENHELSSLVQPGSRAVTVQANAFDGLLRPGDRVDVLPATARTSPELLQNLLVVAIGADTGRDTGPTSAGGPTAVTLTGTVEQSVAIADAARDGTLTLSLRNPDDVVVATRGRDVPGARAGGGPRLPEIEHVR